MGHLGVGLICRHCMLDAEELTDVHCLRDVLWCVLYLSAEIVCVTSLRRSIETALVLEALLHILPAVEVNNQLPPTDGANVIEETCPFDEGGGVISPKKVRGMTRRKLPESAGGIKWDALPFQSSLVEGV